MTHTLIVLDFETTGMSPDLGARPAEVAAVRSAGERLTVSGDLWPNDSLLDSLSFSSWL